jgi:hypothetical protein
MPKFKIGDVVQLNSGGPLMTVRDSTDQGVWVTYVDIDGKFRGLSGAENIRIAEEMLRAVTVDTTGTKPSLAFG